MWYHCFYFSKYSQYFLHHCVTRQKENAWKSICQLNATLVKDCQRPAHDMDDTFECQGQLLMSVFPWQCRTQSNYGNIMYDRRVVRGNTYAQHIIPTVSMKHLFYHAWYLVGFPFFLPLYVYYHPPFTDGTARPWWNTNTTGDQEESHCS